MSILGIIIRSEDEPTTHFGVQLLISRCQVPIFLVLISCWFFKGVRSHLVGTTTKFLGVITEDGNRDSNCGVWTAVVTPELGCVFIRLLRLGERADASALFAA